jgi:hypothetical protein
MVSVPSRASVLDSWWERVSVAHTGRFGGAVTRLRRDPRERSASRGTSAGLLKGLGRGVLWCVVALLLVRGAADLMATAEPPPPARAQLPSPRAEPLTGAERSEIEAVLERLFEAYLAGRTDELEYLSPAGTRLGALGQEHELVGLLSLSQAGPGTADAKDVLATVRARDVETKAVYALRYRLRLVRADRWYVAAINKED